MEVDFDKEIDTLLRKAHRDGPVLVGDFASHHLDADEISAFAENAMPEKSRALYTAHLADCDRCRKILSNLLMMNAEAVPAAASPGAITIAERSIPWYSRLLLFPNLAYVMGGLVLVFAGFLGYSIIQNSGMSDAIVSQVSENESTKGGPNFQGEPAYPGALANSANMSANVASNSAIAGPVTANTNSTRGLSELSGERGPAEPQAGNNFATDGIASTDSTVSPPPPTAAARQLALKDAATRERDDLAKAKGEDKLAAGVPIQESAKNEPMVKQQYPGSGTSQSGPMRNNENQYNRQLENLDRRAAAAKKSDKRDEDAPSGGRKAVGGRTFERKEGVWYDTSYQGRPTINVRRGTPEFNKLAGGLRSIANSFSGTVVIVWGAKAYRIQ